MTAPTPDLDFDAIWQSRRVDGYEAGRADYADALALVTADRDDARRELAEQKRINASNLRVMTEQLELARQQIADAPHDDGCPSWPGHIVGGPKCVCWKEGL